MSRHEQDRWTEELRQHAIKTPSFKAYIETTARGRTVVLPVYGKTQACFKTTQEATAALMRKGMSGRGFVLPCGTGVTLENADPSQILIIDL
jgi:hypothetical protein